MSDICIISDNHFFASGLKALLSFDDRVNIMNPKQVLSDSTFLNDIIVFYIFIHDRQMHLKVCDCLTGVNGMFVFFINCREDNVILVPCFISSRIPIRKARLLSLITTVRLINKKSFNKLSAAKKRRVGCAAKGLPNYMRWVEKRTCTLQSIHYHKKELLKAFGIQRVTVHTFFLAEYIAAGIKAATEVRQRVEP